MMLVYKDSSFTFDLWALEKILKSVFLLESSEEEWGKSHLNENAL